MASVYSIDLELSSSQTAYAADSASLSQTGDISIEGWIKLEQLPSTAGSSFGFVSKAKANQYSWYFYITSAADKLYSAYYGNLDASTRSSTTCDTAFDGDDVGVWRHIAVTIDVSAKAFTFYIDGNAKTDTTDSTTAASIADGSSRLDIGSSDEASFSFFDGKMKNIRIWSDVRSQAEIDDNKCVENSEFTVGVDNLVDAWSFENTLDSQSGNNDLTAVGSPVFSEDVPDCLAVAAAGGFFINMV